MFDPKYIPEVVDVVLSYDAWFARHGKPNDLIFESTRYQKVSTDLGIQLRPRIVLEDAILKVSQGIKKPDELRLSADTVLFLHEGPVNDGCINAVYLKNIGLRILMIYASHEGSSIIEEMEKILSIPDILDHEITPEQQISAISKEFEETKLYRELLFCNGRVLEYFQRLKQIKDRNASGGIPHV